MYIPLYPETEKVRDDRDEAVGVLVPLPDGLPGEGAKKAFSLAHFIPLLRERIYVVSPFTRSYLVSWMNVLDSVPELELISYLPEFLDGLLCVIQQLYFDYFFLNTVHTGNIFRILRKMCELRLKIY